QSFRLVEQPRPDQAVPLAPNCRSALAITLADQAICVRVTNWLSGLLLAAWLLLEVLLRNGDQAARSWRGGDADRSSTRLVVATYVAAFVAPFLLDTSGVGVVHAGSVAAWIGVTVGALGLGLRVWS